MKNKTLTLIGVLIILSALVATSYWYFYQAKAPVVAQTENNQLVGGDRDEHGCIGSAGYSWCQVKDKCLRVWEEACETVKNSDNLAQEETNLEYKNVQYGFNFTLPLTWKGYSVVTETWTGNSVNGTAETFNGPKILIRHPLWTAKNVRQDIPIMIFTLDQWKLIENETLAVSAAPIGPSELGRNDKYVFALPARYNFAFPEGFEEVQKIIDSKPLSAF